MIGFSCWPNVQKVLLICSRSRTSFLLEVRHRPVPTYMSAVAGPIIFVCLHMLMFAGPLLTCKSVVAYVGHH